MTGSCEGRESSSDDAAPLPVWSGSIFECVLLIHLNPTFSNNSSHFHSIPRVPFLDINLISNRKFPFLERLKVQSSTPYDHECSCRGDRRDG